MVPLEERFILTGHDWMDCHGICNKLLDGITNELLPRMPEDFIPKKQPCMLCKKPTQTVNNVLQGEKHLPWTSGPLQHLF